MNRETRETSNIDLDWIEIKSQDARRSRLAIRTASA